IIVDGGAREAPRLAHPLVFEVVGRSLICEFMERRARRLDHDHALDQIGPVVSDAPRINASLRVSHENCRSDFVEKSNTGGSVELFAYHAVFEVRLHHRLKLIEQRITDNATPRPLGMQLGLREKIISLVSNEFALDELRRLWIVRTIDAVNIGRTA